MVQPLLKSFIPLLVGGSFRLLKEISSGSFQNTPNSEGFLESHAMKPKLLDDQETGVSSAGLILDFLNLLNEVSFGVYTNLFGFLLAMLLIDLLIEIVKNGFQRFWKEIQLSRISFAAKDFNLASKNQMKRICSYLGIFMILQIIGFCLSFAESEAFLSHPSWTSSQGSEILQQLQMKEQEEYLPGIPRVLEEVDDYISETPMMMMTSDKISLSMGNILSSLSLNVNAMVLSKDKKTAFVTIDFYGTLQIIDLSDLQSPFIMGSLNLGVSIYSFRIKSLILSSDEKTLYLSNSKELEIVDVTDSRSPKLISLTESEIFTPGTYTSGDEKPSLALLESTNTLYVGGIGLQVYDISDPKKPALLKALKNDLDPDKAINRNEICLSRNGEILFIANRTLDVYNISNPREMKQLYSLKTESSPRSIMLSEDFKTAFLLGTSMETNETIFEEMDISNLNSFKVLKTVHLGYDSIRNARFLAVSPSKSKFFIFANSGDQGVDLLIFDRLKQKVPSNFLWKLLKLDLREIYVNEKTKMNYGIKYQILDDALCFYGKIRNYFKGKTLVVQIKNRKQKIFKEIWIHGVVKDFEKDELVGIRDESQARDQGYEIY